MRNMLIIITGTPGTGKTAIAKELAKELGYESIEIKKIIENDRSLYKMENKEKVVDLKKLRKKIIQKIKGKKNIVLESHLLCEIPLKTKFIFVLRCRPNALKKRLGKRGYEKGKINENILAEMLDYCTQKAEKNFKDMVEIVEFDTDRRNKKETVMEIIKVLNGKRKKGDNINYNKELIEYTKPRN